MQMINFVQRLPQKVLWAIATSLALVGMAMIYWSTAQSVIVVLDGQTREIKTHAKTVGTALEAAGLEPLPEDRVIPSLNSSITDGDVIRLDRAYPVVIELDGEEIIVDTPEKVPANILADAGIRLYPGDRFWVDGYRLQNPSQSLEFQPSRIRVAKAISITLREKGKSRVIHSAAPTVAEALWEAGETLRESDRLIPGPETPIDGSMRVEVFHSRPVIIKVDGKRVESRVVGPSVGEALAESGITLIGLDYAQPDVDEPLPESGPIRVVRVREQIQIELEPLPFDTQYQPVSDLELDTIQVVDSGKYGVLANRIRIRLEDGEEVERTVEEAWEAIEPKPRILGYGTNVVVRKLDVPGGRIEYWRAVPVYATSYSPCNSGGTQCYPYTYSGKLVKKGVIGVTRSWYNAMPGWAVYVPGYGFGTIEDIGAGIAGGDWIDLGFSDKDYEVWHSWTTLYFLAPVPPYDLIPWILP